jgi:hypothetical protein
MKRFIAAACAATMAFTTLGAFTFAASAAPLPRLEAAHGDVQTVQYRSDRRDRRDRFERRRDGHHYYNGHRGFRDRRAGYRQYNGYWFPPTAFIAGAIVGGSIANPPRATRLSDRHVRWCSDRYRSYRVSDNTFQPNRGPRQICRSPY